MQRIHKNGNIVTSTAPHSCTPQPACDANYVTTFAYDDLDRMTSKEVAPGDLSGGDIGLFATGVETFTWDSGAQGKGSLSAWATYAPNASQPTVEIDFGHDAQGNTTDTTAHFDAAGYSGLKREITQGFEISGAPAYVKYHDDVGTSGATSAAYNYDPRGMPESIDLSRAYQASTTVAEQTRNVAGLVVDRNTQITGSPTSPITSVDEKWTYDQLGHVKSQFVQSYPGPKQIAAQYLAYFGNDDPATLDHFIGKKHRQFAYAYDARHQLTSADETTTAKYFSATYAYGDAGRLDQAAEHSDDPAPGSELVPRNVAYQYSATDPEEVQALVDKVTGDDFMSYKYDAAGNQVERSYGTAYPNGTNLSTEYAYDGAGRLRRATQEKSVVALSSEEYWYDGNGSRIATLKRDASGARTELLLFVGPTEAHYDKNGNLKHVYSYVSLGTPVARTDRYGASDAALELISHGLGDSTLAAVDRDTGKIDASFVYAPFGEIVETIDVGGQAGVDAHRYGQVSFLV